MTSASPLATNETGERLIALLENAPGAIFIKDGEGRYTFVSKSFLALAERSYEDVIGRNDEELFGPELAASFGVEDTQVRTHGGPLRFAEHFTYGGRQLWFDTHKYLLPTGEVAAIAVDITAQKEAEEALRLSEERLRHATEGSGVGTYDLNLSTGRGIWSRTAFALLGIDPPDNLEGSYDLWRSSIHPDDVERAEAEHAAAVAEGRVWTMEYRTALPVDRPRWLQAYGHFETHANGDIRSIGVVTDITNRKVWEEHQRLLVGELNHRVKNTLAVVQGLAFQTFRGLGDTAPVKAFEGRLMALAAAHTMLTDENWEAASLEDLVHGVFGAHGVDASRAAVGGPPIRISPEPAVTLTLVMHELATNALKYGALSDRGRADVTWRVTPANLELEWRESGGPPVGEPERRGFGTRMIERAFTQQLGGRVALEFAPGGLIARMSAPLERVHSTGSAGRGPDPGPTEPNPHR